MGEYSWKKSLLETASSTVNTCYWKRSESWLLLARPRIKVFIDKSFNDFDIENTFSNASHLILESEVKDLSKRGLKKIPKTEDSQSVKVLLLDDNELQKIDNIDSFLKIEKVWWRLARVPLAY